MTHSVMVVEDDAALRGAICDSLRLSGLHTLAAADGAAALQLVAERTPDVVISDVQMSRLNGLHLLRELKQRRPELPIVLMTAYGTIQEAVKAMHEGAADYLIKPFEAEVLLAKIRRLVEPRVIPGTDAAMVAVDPVTRSLVGMARRVAASDVTVLLGGESGTGKEVFARYIHQCSSRAKGPFVAVNCAAIPDNMLEAMLFGYEKGAFTGAHKASSGKFEQAQHGTLLLDEVTEMPLGLQAKLLRVLQEREVERLGAREPVELDVRVLATTNRDLTGAVAAGEFREDLYYRLNVFPLLIPPLRERRADIVPLAEHLLAAAAGSMGVAPATLEPEAARRLREHPWPGNVRELDNVIQRSLVLGHGERLTAASLRLDPSPSAAAGPPGLAARRIDGIDGTGGTDAREGVDTLGSGLQEREHHIILDALRSSAGSRAGAAQSLGISARTLRYKLARMRESGFDIPR